MKFGPAIRKARKELGLSLREIGDTVGLSHTYIHEIEMGRRSPPGRSVCVELDRYFSAGGSLVKLAEKDVGEAALEKWRMR